MYKFNFYLDKTFKKGVTVENAREFKKKMLDGKASLKAVLPFLNDKPTSIYMGATINGKYIKVRTDEKVLPVYWDSTMQLVKPNHPNAFALNADLQTLRAKADNTYRNIRSNSEKMSYEKIKALLEEVVKEKLPERNNKSFMEAWAEYIEEKKKLVKPVTIRRLGAVRTHLLTFQKANYPLTFDKITHQYGVDFTYYYSHELKRLNNTISKSLMAVKVFMRWAIKKGYTQNHEFFSFKLKFEEPEMVYLTEAELDRLYNFDLTGRDDLAQIRDVFCFQCFTGQRYSDVLNVRWNDLRRTGDGWEWHLYQRKGNKSKMVLVPLSSRAITIIERYKGQSMEENPLVLPAYCDQYANRMLKVVCKMADITDAITIVNYSDKTRIEKTKPKWQLISSHRGRSTFVTLSLEKGMRPEVVQSITGHESYKVMRRYLSITDKIKKSEFKQAWG